MPEEPKKEKEITEKKSEPVSLPMHKGFKDGELLEAELQDMFDEDKVVHRHGNAEPESD
ncbi:MAG TPA: hypothetical protein VN944_11345 [Nitrospiria bacterium]|nr:hypothetical protein [Nitrospiria bacterium]